MLEYPMMTSNLVGHTFETKMKWLQVPGECFNELLDMPFEDTHMPLPKGYDKYLTIFFGDYMKLPPEDKRNSGHDFDGGIIDLYKSYFDFQTK